MSSSPPSEPSPKRFKPEPAYHRETWTAIHRPGRSTREQQWLDFHRYWWGPNSSGHAVLAEAAASTDLKQRIIRVPQVKAQQAFGLLKPSKGGLLLRQEYTALYDQLSLLSETEDLVIVLGQPGIGKSYFALFALLRRMVEGRIVLFSTADGTTYLFDKAGVKHMLKDKVTVEDIPDDDGLSNASRVWSLIDARIGLAPEGSTPLGTSSLFSVLASSPQESRYKGWAKHTICRKLVAQPWSVEELHLMLSDAANLSDLPPPTRAPYQSLDSVRKLVQDIGPCPRDVVNYLRDPTEFDRAIAEAVESVQFTRQIRGMFTKCQTNMDSFSHALVLIRRSGDIDGPGVVEFKTRQIALRLMTRLKFLEWRSAQELFAVTSRVPGSSTLAGWTFEGLANGYLSGQEHNDPERAVFLDFALMVAMKSTKQRARRFEHTTACETFTTLYNLIEVDEDGDVELTFTATESTSAAQESTSAAKKSTAKKSRGDGQTSQISRNLPITSRDRIMYDDIAAVGLDYTSYYHPVQRNNPLFDSFFLEETRTAVIVWVFQMTISKDHGGAAKGIELLTTLRDRVEKKFAKKVEVKYVLVAPHKSGQTVRWFMPDKWVDLQGDVYVQYLDISFIPGGYKDLFPASA